MSSMAYLREQAVALTARVDALERELVAKHEMLRNLIDILIAEDEGTSPRRLSDELQVLIYRMEERG